MSLVLLQLLLHPHLAHLPSPHFRGYSPSLLSRSSSSMAVGENSTSSSKKGHVCPPSNATHPRDRWEMAFVYAFITKFTAMKPKIEGFINVTEWVLCHLFCEFRRMLRCNVCGCSLEEALMSQRAHPILVQVLSRFILTLRPQTRNLRYVGFCRTPFAWDTFF